MLNSGGGRWSAYWTRIAKIQKCLIEKKNHILVEHSGGKEELIGKMEVEETDLGMIHIDMMVSKKSSLWGAFSEIVEPRLRAGLKK